MGAYGAGHRLAGTHHMAWSSAMSTAGSIAGMVCLLLQADENSCHCGPFWTQQPNATGCLKPNSAAQLQAGRQLG